MIAIVDYHAGNIGSIKNMLLRLGYEATITNNPSDIERATRLILPGVGSFDYGMDKLTSLGLIDVLSRKVKLEGVPILGICLGAQLMCDASEEGVMSGLGWIAGKVRKFPTELEGKKFPVPHIGWDSVTPRKQSRAFAGLHESRFYFVHSYYIQCQVREDVLTENFYGTSFDSSFERGNVLGVQFHPEKSHTFGKLMLRNFVETY